MRTARNNRVPQPVRLFTLLIVVWLLAFFLALPTRGAAPVREQQIRQNLAVWQTWSTERQQALGDKFLAFLRLPGAMRNTLIARYQTVRKLSEFDRKRLRERFETWRGLPPAERQARSLSLRAK